MAAFKAMTLAALFIGTTLATFAGAEVAVLSLVAFATRSSRVEPPVKRSAGGAFIGALFRAFTTIDPTFAL